MVTFILTLIIDGFLTAFLVALAFHSLKLRFKLILSSMKQISFLFIIFIILDVYYLPAVSSLDATITIRNESVTKLLELKPNTPVIDFFKPDWVNVVIYLTQTVMAAFILKKMSEHKESIT